MDDKSEDETFLVSSDTESEFGDENNLFYDEESTTKNSLRAFDRDNGGLSNIYQEKFLPKILDRSHNFMKWLIDTDLLSSTVKCPNEKNDSKCSEFMEFVLAVGLCDLYQLRCKNCSRKESVRKDSIFYGLNCNFRSVLRLIYGWVKGVDIETMVNLLGLEKSVVGGVYNRAARAALSCMGLCPGVELGGENIVVLIDIYPDILGYRNGLKKSCTPILCLSEIESIPQKYWLEPLFHWDKENPKDVEDIKSKVINIILSLVRPGTILVLPNNSTIPLSDDIDIFYQKYSAVKYMEELHRFSSEQRPFSTILETIWKKPLDKCEHAQFFNPDYVSQFLVKEMWNEITDRDSFIMLISFMVYETRRKNMSKLY